MSRQYEIVIDCADPATLGRFWQQVLGYEEAAVPEGYDSWEQYDVEHGVEPNIGWECFDPDGRKPIIFFQRVPEAKTVKNRLHLDLKVPDVNAEVDRLTGLGARTLQVMGDGSAGWTVMTDPEGNEFCVAPMDD